MEELRSKAQEAGGKAAGAHAFAIPPLACATARAQRPAALACLSLRAHCVCPPALPPPAEVSEGSLQIILGDLKSGERRERRKAAEDFQSLLKKARTCTQTASTALVKRGALSLDRSSDAEACGSRLCRKWGRLWNGTRPGRRWRKTSASPPWPRRRSASGSLGNLSRSSSRGCALGGTTRCSLAVSRRQDPCPAGEASLP